MSIKYVVSKHSKIGYYSHKGKGPTLLFIHGAGSNKSIWDPYVKSFKSNKVLTVDLANHGISQEGSTKIKDMVGDCLAVLKKEKVTNAIVIGNSLGSVVGYHLAKKSKSVKKLILVSHYSKEYATAGSLFAPLFVLVGACISIFPNIRKREYQEYYHRDGSFKDFRFPIDVKGTFLDKYCFCAANSIYKRASLKKITIPTLALHGSEDWMINYDKIKKEAKKNKRVTYVEVDSHHHLLTTKSKKVIKLIKEFIKK